MSNDELEFIGMKIEIVESSNEQNIGIKGKVVYETKNMFQIETESGIKKIVKRQNKFQFKSKGKCFLMDGKSIEKKPENRIKTK